MAENVTDDAINLRPIKHSTKKRKVKKRKEKGNLYLPANQNSPGVHLTISRHSFLEKKFAGAHFYGAEIVGDIHLSYAL